MELHNDIELQDSIPWVLMFLQLLDSNLSVYIYSNGPKLEDMSFLHIHNRYQSVGSDGNLMSRVFFTILKLPSPVEQSPVVMDTEIVTTRALHCNNLVKTQSMFPLCKLIEVKRVCLARDQSSS
jgi:hypothetical protein